MGESVPPVPTTAGREWKRADNRISGPECTPHLLLHDVAENTDK